MRCHPDWQSSALEGAGGPPRRCVSLGLAPAASGTSCQRDELSLTAGWAEPGARPPLSPAPSPFLLGRCSEKRAQFKGDQEPLSLCQAKGWLSGGQGCHAHSNSQERQLTRSSRVGNRRFHFSQAEPRGPEGAGGKYTQRGFTPRPQGGCRGLLVCHWVFAKRQRSDEEAWDTGTSPTERCALSPGLADSPTDALGEHDHGFTDHGVTLHWERF